jgi:hypothetical protein
LTDFPINARNDFLSSRGPSWLNARSLKALACYIVVGIVNHPSASAARPALNSLIEWAVQDGK